MGEPVDLHVRRDGESTAAIDVLAGLVGGRAGLEAVLADLDRRGRRTVAPGLLARGVFTWDRTDRTTKQWMPQGITFSAAGEPGRRRDDRRDLVLTTWYAKDIGDGRPASRISMVDLSTRRYRHVLLMTARLRDGAPVMEPLHTHAGGAVWAGPWLFVASTLQGLHVCHLDDILRMPDDAPFTTYGYRYVLPVRFRYTAPAKGDGRLRYSFVSLDRSTTPPHVVVGEYNRGDVAKRLAHFELDPESGLLAGEDDSVCRPVTVDDGGVAQVQGAARADGRYHLTVSHGPWVPGSVYVGSPGAWHHHKWAVPMGPEDLAYWPQRDELWSLTEHPHRRWVFRVKRSRLRR